ncbi:hypothetical protein [Weizmannia acidilactici]|uniref:hypothetical protein n=1 Tax=Weizmannia acidilactici TaxID=2607726 RepID=UPI00124E50C1|nr:hypothetical protein [Weizmannia acidilactici]GER75214.1 hypothetical protein BpPP18_32810 [Weizmannia acidilactici]
MKGIQEIESSEGWRIINKIDNLQLSYTVFRRNYEELNKLLSKYESDQDLALQLMVRDNRESFNAFLGEITRLLHNFLVSVKSLVDHTRIFYQEEYEGTEFENDYNEKIEEHFSNVPVSKFVQELRNYTLHKALPLTGATINIDKEKGMSQSITLNIDSLRDWKKWSKLSREYMDSNDKNLVLRKTVNDYAQKVEEFYKWFGNCLQEIHKEALEELEELQNKQRERYEEAGFKL